MHAPLAALLLAAGIAGAAASAAHAQAAPPATSAGAGAAGPEAQTLRKIRESGVVSVGYRDGSLPFSYLDDKQRPVGYSIDLCMRIVDAVKQQLSLPRLDVRMVPVTPATRIALVATGAIDLECGVTTNTLERQKHVAFTVTTFVTYGKLLWKRSSGFASVADLRGRTVVSTVGTTNIQQLGEFNQQRGLDLRILAAGDDARAFRMVQSDRAAAYAMDEVLLKGSLAAEPQPERYAISDDALSVEPYAIMVRKDDPGFKRLADDAIVALYRSGDIRAIYRRWFESPVPPRGDNLRLPMSPALERAIAQPTDSGDPAAYR